MPAPAEAISTAGSESENVAPRPGSDSTQSRPPFRLANPRAIARPRPEPRSPAPVPRQNGSKIDSRSSASDARARGRRREIDHLAVRDRGAHLDGVGGRGVAERVLDQVDEHTLDLRRVDAHRGALVGQRRDDAVAVGADRLQRTPDELVHRPELDDRARGAGLEPREVEQVRDQPVEPPRLGADRREQLVAIARRRALAGSASISLAVAIAVSGERRSWLTDRSTAVFVASLRLSSSRSSGGREQRRESTGGDPAEERRLGRARGLEEQRSRSGGRRPRAREPARRDPASVAGRARSSSA